MHSRRKTVCRPWPPLADARRRIPQRAGRRTCFLLFLDQIGPAYRAAGESYAICRRNRLVCMHKRRNVAAGRQYRAAALCHAGTKRRSLRL